MKACIETVCSLRSLRSYSGWLWLRCLWSCIQRIYRQGRFSYVPQHQSGRVGVQALQQGCILKATSSFRMLQKQHNLTNRASSQRAFTTFFYITETSAPDIDSDVVKKRKLDIYCILSSQRHVITPHADKRVPIELKATSLLIPLTLAQAGLWEFLVWHHIPSTFTTAKKREEKKWKKRIYALKGTNKSIYNMWPIPLPCCKMLFYTNEPIKETLTLLPVCFTDSVLHLVT